MVAWMPASCTKYHVANAGGSNSNQRVTARRTSQAKAAKEMPAYSRGTTCRSAV